MLGVDGVGAHGLVEIPAASARRLDATRRLSADTEACLAIRNSVFQELVGFDPLLEVDFNDVDFRCAAIEASYRNLYIAEPLLHHHESLSRGLEESRTKRTRNTLEAIRVLERHAQLIRDPPTIRICLIEVARSRSVAGGASMAPCSQCVPRVLLLSPLRERGTIIARVVVEQAAYLMVFGFEVIVGGPECDEDDDAHGWRHMTLANADESVVFAASEGVDAIAAHSAPLFSVMRHLGGRPLVYAVDHGDPPPDRFPDQEAREDQILAKRLDMALPKRVFAASYAARDPLAEEGKILQQEMPFMPAVLAETMALDLERDSAAHWI